MGIHENPELVSVPIEGRVPSFHSRYKTGAPIVFLGLSNSYWKITRILNINPLLYFINRFVCAKDTKDLLFKPVRMKINVSPTLFLGWQRGNIFWLQLYLPSRDKAYLFLPPQARVQGGQNGPVSTILPLALYKRG